MCVREREIIHWKIKLLVVGSLSSGTIIDFFKVFFVFWGEREGIKIVHCHNAGMCQTDLGSHLISILSCMIAGKSLNLSDTKFSRL